MNVVTYILFKFQGVSAIQNAWIVVTRLDTAISGPARLRHGGAMEAPAASVFPICYWTDVGHRGCFLNDINAPCRLGRAVFFCNDYFISFYSLAISAA